MEKLTLKHQQLLTALDRMKEAIDHLKNIENNKLKIPDMPQEEFYRIVRDSLIQRFEFCSDQFWKYLKRFLEEKLSQGIEITAPRPVIRTACKIKLLTEEDTLVLIKMIDDRNMSSHIYKEEIADIISAKTANYYKIMRHYAQKLTPAQ